VREHGNSHNAAVTELVRICPVCDTENAPQRPRCACGASLAGVDFSLPRAAREAPLGVDSATGAVQSTADDDASQGVGQDVVVSNGAAPLVTVSSGAVSSSDTSSPNAGGDNDDVLAPFLDAAPGLRCPYPDCGQPNPPGATRCVYCNRALDAIAAQASASRDDAVASARPLPAALRDRFRVRDVFPATGSEADILLVERAGTREPAVVKLYRKGIEPDFHLLDILSASSGDTVVHVLDHGVSDGVAYEVLEYIPGGTLEAYMGTGPLSSADVRRIVAQIASALDAIHAQRILHRDLKPENVLVRSRSPLSLALTDFGIASLAAATQHFTSVARTTRYAAPEVLTGVIDPKCDWWSLGMIALEAATGRHPFDGLTEQVMNHQLATRPIDVRGVFDDDLRKLCRGLLMRDPRRRWGSAEVARWLAGDVALEAPQESEPAATMVTPYRIGGAECTTAEELAVAMARHWSDARKDLARGQVSRWVEHELHDYNLVRRLRDLQEDRGIDDDMRTLRFLRAACPALPPVWIGTPLTRAAILALARRAAEGEGDAQAWLDSAWRNAVLAEFAGDGELAQIDRAWREGWQRFTDLWHAAERMHAAWRKQSRGAPHVDDLIYGDVGRPELPDPAGVHGPLLLVLHEPAYRDLVRGEIASAHARAAVPPAWLEALLRQLFGDDVALLVARSFIAIASADAASEARRAAELDHAREGAVEEARDALRRQVQAILALAPENRSVGGHTVELLTEAFAHLGVLCSGLLALDLADSRYEALRTHVEKLHVQGLAVQRALAESERDRGVADIMNPQRLAFAGGALVIALLTRIAWVVVAALSIAATYAIWRWYVSFHSNDGLAIALRRFRLTARGFVHGEEQLQSERDATKDKSCRSWRPVDESAQRETSRRG
jgi:hypothetical protein